MSQKAHCKRHEPEFRKYLGLLEKKKDFIKDKKYQHTPEQIKLIETQDLKYVSYKRNIEAKKIDKLQSQLHIIDAANKTQYQHILFLDNNTEMKNFDLAKKLNTHPTFLSRRTNRPTLSHMAYKELEKRIDRKRELTIVEQKLEVRRALKDKKIKKPILVKSGSKNVAPIYKWKFERKR
ncbi:hypothetical protein PUN28_018459 [Cardiocondyla obscurior]|uniref:Probable U3 small nucleolar RNA-associated protein 11 n=1 Tax=Cardiocondyla obscurior TaxID=286306 RepID=A0AAW2EHR9_9HYME